MGSATRLTDQDIANLRQLNRQLSEELSLLGCELHDGMLQYITAAHLLTEAAKRRCEQSGQPVPTELEQVRDYLQQAMQEGRRLLGGLQPIELGGDKLVPAIGLLIQDASARVATQIALSEVVSHEISDASQQVIYRVVQECLNNIVRHAGAAHATVELSTTETQVRLRVSDDGCGFDPEQVPSDHFGLQGLRRRVEISGGTVTVTSQPGQGSTVECVLPRA
ncbi:MAG: sensor histidine kinase [Planctomycetales bacterium]|nr:sensor histidine kinase [Planctomycetales bacterium]